MNGGELIVVFDGTELGLDAFLCGRIDNDRIEPLAKRQARPARRFLRSLARLRPDSFYAPRHAKFHSRTCIRGGGAKSRWALVEPARVNGEWKTGAVLSPRTDFLPFTVKKRLRTGRSTGTLCQFTHGSGL